MKATVIDFKKELVNEFRHFDAKAPKEKLETLRSAATVVRKLLNAEESARVAAVNSKEIGNGALIDWQRLKRKREIIISQGLRSLSIDEANQQLAAGITLMAWLRDCMMMPLEETPKPYIKR